MLYPVIRPISNGVVDETRLDEIRLRKLLSLDSLAIRRDCNSLPCDIRRPPGSVAVLPILNIDLTPFTTLGTQPRWLGSLWLTFRERTCVSMSLSQAIVASRRIRMGLGFALLVALTGCGEGGEGVNPSRESISVIGPVSYQARTSFLAFPSSTASPQPLVIPRLILRPVSRGRVFLRSGLPASLTVQVTRSPSANALTVCSARAMAAAAITAHLTAGIGGHRATTVILSSLSFTR